MVDGVSFADVRAAVRLAGRKALGASAGQPGPTGASFATGREARQRVQRDVRTGPRMLGDFAGARRCDGGNDRRRLRNWPGRQSREVFYARAEIGINGQNSKPEQAAAGTRRRRERSDSRRSSCIGNQGVVRFRGVCIRPYETVRLLYIPLSEGPGRLRPLF